MTCILGDPKWIKIMTEAHGIKLSHIRVMALAQHQLLCDSFSEGDSMAVWLKQLSGGSVKAGKGNAVDEGEIWGIRAHQQLQGSSVQWIRYMAEENLG